MLSARQALVRAAVAGWRGDDASGWPSPNTEDAILAWASSYGVAEDEQLTKTLVALAKEGLFIRVLYSIFAQPVYYCSYDVSFLDELPDNIGEWIPGSNIHFGTENDLDGARLRSTVRLMGRHGFIGVAVSDREVKVEIQIRALV